MVRKMLTQSVFLAVFSVTAYCETYTLETYYPSPVGAYANMTVTQSAVLARDGGSVGIGTSAPGSGVLLNVNGPVSADSVGIGISAPAAGVTLDINGLMVVGRSATNPACVSGAIYYNTGSGLFLGCSNGVWQSFSVVTPPVPPGSQNFAISTPDKTFTPVAGLTGVTVQLCAGGGGGGGGGGGYGNINSGVFLGGGGGGEGGNCVPLNSAYLSVDPAKTYTVVVGDGGAGGSGGAGNVYGAGAAGGVGSTGGASAFQYNGTNLLIQYGGSGGAGGGPTNYVGPGGAGGTGSGHAGVTTTGATGGAGGTGGAGSDGSAGTNATIKLGGTGGAGGKGQPGYVNISW